MNTVFFASHIHGSVNAPCSKSYLQRAVFCSALADGTSIINNISCSEDAYASIRCAEALGAKIVDNNNTLIIDGGIDTQGEKLINCGESGTSLRLLLPALSVLGINAILTGSGRLLNRPLDIYKNVLPGITVYPDNIKIAGKLAGGDFFVPGNVSSQFVSGLLLALPLAGENSTITLTSALESAPYVDITTDVMQRFGIDIERSENSFFVKGSRKYKACTFDCEGDWSQAAFLLCMGALSGEVTVNNLNMDSLQGDKAILNLLSDFGADIKTVSNAITVKKHQMQPFNFCIPQTPDLAPAAAVLAAYANGRSVISDVSRLAYKESNRIDAIINMVNSIGGNAILRDNSIIIDGGGQLNGGTVLSHNDHRIAMATAVAATNCGGRINIDNVDCIQKSYPNFMQDYKSIGGVADVIMG